MLVVMRMDASSDEIEGVVHRVESKGLKANPIAGAQRTAVGITGNIGVVEPGLFESMPGVLEVIQVSHPYKLVSREFRAENTVLDIGGVKIGGRDLLIIAGPCSVESYEQTLRIAQTIKASGGHLLRGGAFKPRTSPYSFQGLGLQGLKILARVREATGLPVVSEALDIDVLDDVAEYADIVQIGARNMQNYTLLRRAGQCRRPVLLKRGMNATVTELLLAAEYILDQGNDQVILCERGIRTFTDHTRNTLDVAAIPAVKRISHLPIIADPSHAAGQRDKVIPLARASVAVGADGLMVEVHDQPDEALSDGNQALLPDQFSELMEEIRLLASVLDRQIPSQASQHPR
ncbi:MAG: 3-deoxy-7-phosphoheptulonate synthase [Thermoanaerobaculia bacterium]